MFEGEKKNMATVRLLEDVLGREIQPRKSIWKDKCFSKSRIDAIRKIVVKVVTRAEVRTPFARGAALARSFEKVWRRSQRCLAKAKIFGI